MSFFNKIYDIMHIDLFKYVFHSGSDKVFVAKYGRTEPFVTISRPCLTVCSGIIQVITALAQFI